MFDMCFIFFPEKNNEVTFKKADVSHLAADMPFCDVLRFCLGRRLSGDQYVCALKCLRLTA